MTGSTLLIGAIASAASCLLCVEVGGISLKDSMVLPAHARKEVVHRQHQGVIRQMESIIRSCRDLAAVERRVKDTSWPDKVLHISLASPGRSASSQSAYSKTMWTNMRTVIRDGAGYGTVLTADGHRDLLVVDSSCRCAGRDTVGYTIYLEQPVR